MSLRANATKPQRNVSTIVDLQKRNFRSELTVTIPDNDTLTLPFLEETDHFYASTSFNALSTCANSQLFQHFVNCFDQMKLMDVHYCIDLASAPQYTCSVYQMHCGRVQMAYSLDDGVSWETFNDVTNIPDPQDPLHPIHVITQNTMDTLNAYFPVDGMYPANFDPNNLPDHPVSTIQFECPLTLCAATRRGVPRGFFQPDPVINYSTPSFNDIMAHGSAIYQSKMPGSGVHLSLDCMGSSNSERMMTFPTQMINRLYQLQPSLQSGRFAPTIMIGVKADKFSVDQLRNELTGYCNSTGAQNYVYHQNVQPEFTGAWQAFVAVAQRWNNGAYVNMPVTVKVRCVYSFNMTDGLGLLIPMTDQEFAERIRYTDLTWSDVTLSIQGYHSCRFKQLRTMPSDKGWTFGYLNFNWKHRAGMLGIATRRLVFDTDTFDQVLQDPQHVPIIYGINFRGRYYIHYKTKINGHFSFAEFAANGPAIVAVLLLKVGGDRIEASIVSTTVADNTENGYHVIAVVGQTWLNDVGTFCDSYDYMAVLATHDVAGQSNAYDYVNNPINGLYQIMGKGVGSIVCVDRMNNPSVYSISNGDPERTYTVSGTTYSVVTTYLYNVQLKGIKPSV